MEVAIIEFKDVLRLYTLLRCFWNLNFVLFVLLYRPGWLWLQKRSVYFCLPGSELKSRHPCPAWDSNSFALECEVDIVIGSVLSLT